MDRKVLLTGATGFLGKHVLNCLLDRGIPTKIIIRENKIVIPPKNNLLEIVTTTDLFSEDVKWWRDQCEGIDTIIHLAWYAEPGKYLNSPENINCLIGSLNLVKGALLAGIAKFVGAGTCFEYDSDYAFLDINTPINPKTIYSDTKAALFFSIKDWLRNENVDFAWCRLFYLFGDGEDSRRLVPYIRKNLEAGNEVKLTKGNQIRDYLNIEIAAELITDVSLGEILGPVNICSGEPISVKQFAQNIADEYDLRDKLKFGAKEENIFDPQCIVGLKRNL